MAQLHQDNAAGRQTGGHRFQNPTRMQVRIPCRPEQRGGRLPIAHLRGQGAAILGIDVRWIGHHQVPGCARAQRRVHIALLKAHTLQLQSLRRHCQGVATRPLQSFGLGIDTDYVQARQLQRQGHGQGTAARAHV